MFIGSLLRNTYTNFSCFLKAEPRKHFPFYTAWAMHREPKKKKKREENFLQEIEIASSWCSITIIKKFTFTPHASTYIEHDKLACIGVYGRQYILFYNKMIY